MRLALAPAIADAAAFDGWGEEAVRAAAEQVGIDPDAALFAFQGGAIDMIDAWIAAIDADMVAAFPADKLAGMKIREKIRSLVQFRLDTIAWQQEALRRALAIMAMPQNAPRAVRLGWRSADAMWRLKSGRLMHAARVNTRTPRPAAAGAACLR